MERRYGYNQNGVNILGDKIGYNKKCLINRNNRDYV